jgi:uridine kinase
MPVRALPNRNGIRVSVGASGSGKTTFTSRLEKLMNNVTVISMDMYNDGSKVMENNFDDPRIIDYDYLISNLDDLRSGRRTKVPIYDFKTSKRTGYRDVAVPESRVVIIEVR